LDTELTIGTEALATKAGCDTTGYGSTGDSVEWMYSSCNCDSDSQWKMLQEKNQGCEHVSAEAEQVVVAKANQ
jgi:hypothetical protein